MFLVVGELINSSRREVGRAIGEKDERLIRDLARRQSAGGADVIDLNAGQSMENENRDLLWLIDVVQNELGKDVRLAIDTSDPTVMESGLEACSTPPVINSISNEEKSGKILELASKGGAEVVGLAMGANGMPKSARDRLEEARALIEKCGRAGIDQDRLYVDVICMSVGSSAEQGKEVLDGLRLIKSELAVKAFAAASNVSFGLPNRHLLNRTFMAMLIEAGLDGAIMDPTDKRMMQAICASRALTGRDRFCMQYIKKEKRRKEESDAG